VDKTVARLRKLALIEGISFLVILFITMPLKYGLDMPGPNLVFGMLHGILFVAYVAYFLYVWAERRWNFATLAWGFAASVIPFLVFWVERKIFAPLAKSN
jgi:integral membrane protein